MLFEAAQKILTQLHDFCSQLGNEKYGRPITELNGAGIGAHTRHVIEFFECLIIGTESGVVNYDQRKHDKNLEENLELSLGKIKNIKSRLSKLNTSCLLELQCSYSLNDYEKPVCIQTTVERELVYNIEHAIHHMAIIKIAASIIAPEIKTPQDFGIAVSTLKYRESHVHSNISA